MILVRVSQVFSDITCNGCEGVDAFKLACCPYVLDIPWAKVFFSDWLITAQRLTLCGENFESVLSFSRD